MNSDKYLKLIHPFAVQLLLIAELEFEDCVFCLSDPSSGHMIQPAVYGL